MRIARSVLLLTLIGTAAYGAEVYRSTDPNGNVSYSDRPQNEAAQPVTILAPHGGAPATPRTAAARPNTPANPATPANPDAVPPRPQTASEKAAEKAKNCEDAKVRNNSFATARRLYRTGANGEREYLKDTEIDEARAKAAADVKTFCG